MADLTGNHAHGTQHDAFLAENDPVQRRSVAKERKLSLGAKNLGEHGGHNSADDLLTAMGYKAELVRSRSTLQVAFMSFVLASIPYGLATTMYYPLVGGGPANIIWGWVAVSIIILCVAASLGEITSVYPTAGGVYYQTWMLSGPSYRKVASWICGWNFVVGNITITLAVNFGTALFLGGCINVFEVDNGAGGVKGIFANEPYQIYLIFVGITLLCNIVSSLGNKWLPLLDVRYALQTHSAPLLTLNLDFRHLLDIRWLDLHCRVCARHRKEWTPQRIICIW
jgi:hypothetical protein